MSLEPSLDKTRPPTGRPKRFVTFRELQEELGWSRRTIYRRIADGSIRQPVKIDRQRNGWPREYIADLMARIERGEAAWQ